MSELKNFYTDFIKSQIVLDFLKQGKIPAIDDINHEFDVRTEGKDLSQPQFAYKDWEVANGEKGSAGKFNNMVQALYQDLDVIYQALMGAGEDSATHLDETLAQIKGLQTRLMDVLSKATQKLMALQNTDGYFEVIADTFANMELVNQELTTATVDLKSQAVHAGYLRSDTTNDLHRIFPVPTDVRISFSSISRKDVKSTTQAPGPMKPFDILSDQSTPWLMTVIAKSGSVPISVQMVIEFLYEKHDLSKLIVNTHNSFGGGRLTIGIQVTEDGVNWRSAGQEPIKTITTSSALWLMNEKNVKAIKFIMTKSGADKQATEGFLYDFGFERIELYDCSYITDDETELISKNLTAVNPDNSLVEFNKIALDVCENVPKGTQLEYEVAFGYQHLDGSITNELIFHPIDPIQRQYPTKPQFLEVSATERKASRYVVPKPEADQPRCMLADVHGGTVLDYILDSKTIESQLVVLRNVKNYKRPYTTHIDGATPHPKGWNIQDKWYQCYANIRYPNGLTLDFGNTEIEIDDVIMTGLVQLAPGLHKIRVHPKNWYDLDNQANSSDLNFVDVPATPLGLVTGFDYLTKTFTGLGKYPGTDYPAGISPITCQDPLFPYNHKTMIEGMYFDSGLSSAIMKLIPYPDASFITIAGDKMKYTSPYDFITNALPAKQYSYYTVIDVERKDMDDGEGIARGIAIGQVVTTDLADFMQILNGTPLDPTTLEAMLVQEYAVIEKVKAGLSTQVFLDSANLVVFKARFITSDPNDSPVLEGYKVKLGE